MKKRTYDHADFCHCSDWKKDICPKSCFRAGLTQDYHENGYPYPVSFSNFGSDPDFCPLKAREKNE